MTMRRLLVALCLSSASLAVGCASRVARPEVPRSEIVPLRTVRLYETGVGYFERTGRVGTGASLPVPASHLDDALKTLVLLGGEGGGPVTALSFPSGVSATRARAMMGLPGGSQPIRFRDLLVSLKGERVTLTTSKTERTGIVVDVVDEPSPHEGAKDADDKGKEQKPKEAAFLVLLGDGGELAREKVDDLHDVRPLDPTFAARLGGALLALSPRHAQIRKDLSVLGTRTGPITFGYVAETPVWRSSYRVVLAEGGGKAALQAFALVHNDTDEDWRDVKLELASGKPDSFLFPLAAPRYRHRDVHGPEDGLSTVPQLGDTTADELFGEGSHGTGSGYGYGSGSGRLGGSHTTRPPSVRMGMTSVADGTRLGTSDLLDVGNLAPIAPATVTEEASLFVFRPEAAFSLPARSSALVPVLSREVTALPLVLFSGFGSSGRTALRLMNTTGAALPAGTVSVFGHGGLVGEAIFERLPAGESRLLTVGDEIDVEVREPNRAEAKEETKRIVFHPTRGLAEHFLLTTVHTLEVENRSGRDRTLWIGADITKNGKILGTDGVVTDATVDRPHLVLESPKKTKGTRTVTYVEGLSRTTSPRSIDHARVFDLSKKPGLGGTEQAALREAADLLAEERTAKDKAAAAQREVAAADGDIERVREHLRAMGDKAQGAAQPLVKRVIDAEDRREAAKKRQEAAEKDAQAKHDKALVALGRLARE